MTSINIFTLGCSKWLELLLTSQRGTREVCWSQAVDPISGWIYSWKTFYRKRNGAVVIRQSIGWSGNKKHQMVFSQYLRESTREFCVQQFFPVQTCRKASLPSPPPKPQVKQLGEHVCPLKWPQSNCLRHLCAGYCIGCSAARVVRQHITVQTLFKYL